MPSTRRRAVSAWNPLWPMIVAGHRGFKARVAENTIEGFTRCYDAGATVVETDVWISQDGVLVVSHDAWTSRGWLDAAGKQARYHIPDTSFHDVLSSLKTAGTGEPFLRLADVLAWFVKDTLVRPDPGQYRIMLDIKRRNPPRVARLIVEALLCARNDMQWWFPRVQLAVWDLDVVRFMNQDYFFADVFTATATATATAAAAARAPSQFDVFHVSVSWADSMRYASYNNYLDRAKIPRAGAPVRVTGILMIYIAMWSRPFLTHFVPVLRQQNLKLYAWTVNTPVQYDFVEAVGRHAGLCEYGVISDWPDAMAVKSQCRAHTPAKLSREALASGTPCDLSSLPITMNQRACHWMYSVFARLVRARQPRIPDRGFDALVDGDVIRDVPVPPFYAWVFQTLQAYNVF